MSAFYDLKELFSALNRETRLIAEMFSKRKSMDYKYSDALELLNYEEHRLAFLLGKGVVRENAGVLELDDLYLEFFEQVLDINEEINLAYIDDNIKHIKENIVYYLNESNQYRKHGYLKFIKKTLRKIGIITIKSAIDLRRNVENTFKNEINYKIKQLKLNNFDEKRTIIKSLIDQSLKLVNEDELTFFNRALDVELNREIIELKQRLNECSHNLIEIEKQIIDYLHQIKIQGEFLEKLRKLKYLKDHFLIESQSNLRQVLSQQNALLYEPRRIEPLKLSLDFLRLDDKSFELIKRLAHSKKHLPPLKNELAAPIASDYLTAIVEKEVMINYAEVKNTFLATSDDLFSFIYKYDFFKEVDFAERVTIFCQVISLFENDLLVTNEYRIFNGIEHAVVMAR
ncbi:MAG: hypothetical protein GX801_02525 [Fibrobacter sp.]|nr:hypothetical protein [Fibrobacter sp.]